MKHCPGCGETKPLSEFGRDRRSPDGYTAWCKPCRNADARRLYNGNLTANRAKKRAASAKRRTRPEVRLAEAMHMRDWRRANPARAREINRRARAKLAEQGYFRDWYWRNADKERERQRLAMRKLRAERPDLERARKRRYRKRNAEAVARREREKTYARRAKQPYSHELAVLMSELVQQPCIYCGTQGNITIDHIMPLSRGGKHEAGNLAPACFSCNASKCDQLLSEWNGRL